jgi:antitoxin component YwqK of YwqJK toxin-antitoxin module
MQKIFFIFLLTIASSIYSQDLENGTYQEFFDNKNPKYEISYLNGEKNGIEKFWYESGQLKMQSEFKNGKETWALAAMV